MRAFFRTIRYMLKAQLRSPLYMLLALVALSCAAFPLFALQPSGKAVALCDQDGSALSRALVSRAMGSRAMRLEAVSERDLSSALDRLRNGVLEAVFVVGKGYGAGIESGEYKDAVKLYLSPYSTSARTFSESVAAIVMSQWLEQAAASEAEKQMGAKAAEETRKLFFANKPPILLLQIEGENASQGEAPASPIAQAQNALFLLSAFSCFLLLCFSGAGGRERDGLVERFISRGWSPAAYAFARTGSWAIAPVLAALIPCGVLAAAGEPGTGVMAYLSFLFFLVSWAGLSAALNNLTHNPTVQLTLASVLAILNAIFSYPAGLFQNAGFARFLFPGWWLMQTFGQGEWMMALPLAAMAMEAVGLGILAVKARAK